jgi:predicted hotdog family 3-hydroxylacyl-ACP dehydratase
MALLTADIRELIPHGGSMCLLERVVSWDALCLRAATTTHRQADNPLLRNGKLDSVHLCEYGAQAMALHGGLLAQQRGERAAPGLLVSLRDVVLRPIAVQECAGELEVFALRLLGDGNGWQYEVKVSNQSRELASGRVAVVLRRG